MYQQLRGALRAPKCERRHHPAGTRRDPHQGPMPNDTRRAARHVRPEAPGTNRLLAVRRTRYTTRHQLSHQQTRPNLGQPNTDLFRRSLVRLALPQGDEEMDPQPQRGHRGYRRVHRSDWGGDRDDRKSISAYISVVADALTKALPHPQHVTLTEMMGVYERN